MENFCHTVQSAKSWEVCSFFFLQMHQFALQKSLDLMETISAADLIRVSLAMSAAHLGLSFKSSLPPSMCACTQLEHFFPPLSHSVSLVSTWTVLSTIQICMLMATYSKERCHVAVLRNICGPKTDEISWENGIMVNFAQGIPFKMQPWLLPMNPFLHKMTKPWQYWILAAVSHCCRRWAALNCKPINSAVLSVSDHLLQTNAYSVLIFCYQFMYCLLSYLAFCQYMHC
jgi:hypothetical protein